MFSGYRSSFVVILSVISFATFLSACLVAILRCALNYIFAGVHRPFTYNYTSTSVRYVPSIFKSQVFNTRLLRNSKNSIRALRSYLMVSILCSRWHREILGS